MQYSPLRSPPLQEQTVRIMLPPPIITMQIMTTAGLILNIEEGGTTTREEGVVAGAKRELHPARTDPGGRIGGGKPWTPVPTVRGTTAEDAALETTIAWTTSMSEGKEVEVEEEGIRAGIILMTTHHPQNLLESWSHWRNLSTFC